MLILNLDIILFIFENNIYNDFLKRRFKNLFWFFILQFTKKIIFNFFYINFQVNVFYQNATLCNFFHLKISMNHCLKFQLIFTFGNGLEYDLKFICDNFGVNSLNYENVFPEDS